MNIKLMKMGGVGVYPIAGAIQKDSGGYVTCEDIVKKDEIEDLKNFIKEQFKRKNYSVSIKRACQCFCECSCKWCSYASMKEECDKLSLFKSMLIDD